MTLVILDNLPQSFSEATLKSLLSHVPAAGQVLSFSLLPNGDRVSAQVVFERADDADIAVKLWDQLTIDSVTIQATQESTADPKQRRPTSAEGQAGRYGHGPHGGASAGPGGCPRYPLAPMNIGWLFEFVNGLKNPQKGYTMCRVLECLMCSAVETSDPFIEHAVVHFYTKFTCGNWSKAQGLLADGLSFELCRQVFEVIGLIRRYPNANPKSRTMLLTLVERVVDDISKVPITSKTSQIHRLLPEIVENVRSSITALRNESNVDPDGSLHVLTSWLKFLFACLSSQQSQNPHFSDHEGCEGAGSGGIAPCGEHCPCAPRLRKLFPVYYSDVEKVKVIDALVVSSGMDRDEGIGNIARDLLQRYNIEYCTRAVTHVHNGHIALARLHLFEACRILRRVQVQDSVAEKPPSATSDSLRCHNQSIIPVSKDDQDSATIHHFNDIHNIYTIAHYANSFGTTPGIQDETLPSDAEKAKKFSSGKCANGENIDTVGEGIAGNDLHVQNNIRYIDLIDIALNMVSQVVPSILATQQRVKIGRGAKSEGSKLTEDKEIELHKIGINACQVKNNANNSSIRSLLKICFVQLEDLRDAVVSCFSNVFGTAFETDGVETCKNISEIVYNLQFSLQQLLFLLCTPALMLCVHPSVDVHTPYRSLLARPGNAKASKKSSAAEEASSVDGKPEKGNKRQHDEKMGADTDNVAGGVPEKKSNPKPTPKCANPTCGLQKAPGVELLKCSACKMTYYCSSACQRADWKAHKELCNKK